MTALAPARPGLLARLFLAFLILSGLGSCGGGGVSPVVNDPTRITIQPDTAIMYSGLPTTFIVSGGTGAYIVTSSNQAVLQVSGAISPSPITLFANPVTTDTPVTLTVRDTGTAPLATATLTVRPNPVSNNITVTPSATQGGSCAPAVCSGGDAEVSATISQGGIPLPARAVRLEALTGDFRFIVSPAGQPEVLATSVDVITDETGRVRARIRVLADAPNQTALLQVTDLGTGAFQRSSFIISQSTGPSPGFFVTPTGITFSGRFTGQCANNLSALFYVFGGVPPYSILNTAVDAFSTSQSVVSESGESFSVTARGVCTSASGLPIVVRDAAGRTTTVTVANVEGTTVPTPVVASPDTVFIEDCTSTASFTVSGGAGNYFVSSGSNAFLASISGATVTIRRRATAASPSGPVPSPILVGVSDGRTSASVSVEHSSGTFPVCPSSTLAVSPSSVTLARCGPVTLTVSGGSGIYSAASDNSSVTVTQITGTTFEVKRTALSAGFTPPATITVSDGTATQLVTVNATGTGAGSGTGACP